MGGTIRSITRLATLASLPIALAMAQSSCSDSPARASGRERPTRIHHYAQTARSGTLVVQGGDAARYTLTMVGVPYEIFGIIKEPVADIRSAPFNAFARQFIAAFPPGAAMGVLKLEEGLPQPTSVTLELLHVSYDADHRTSIYDVRLVPNEATPEELREFVQEGGPAPEAFASPTLVADAIDHGWHYQPKAGDKLGDGASANFESPAHRGVIGLANTGTQNVSLKVEQSSGLGLWNLTFTMEPGASLCAWYAGLWGLSVSAASEDAYVEISRDESVACGGWFKPSCSDSQFSGCSNKLNVGPQSAWDQEGLEAIEGIVDVIGAFLQ